MKCYRHPEVDAVGVCSECSRGVCPACEVTVGGKLYCKPDTDKIFGKGGTGVRSSGAAGRPLLVSLISPAFVVYGLAELMLSFFLIYAGMSINSFKSVTVVLPSTFTVDLIDANVSLLPLLLGLVLLFTSVVGVGAGVEIWRRSRVGVVMAFVQVIVAIIAGLIFIPPSAVPAYAGEFYALMGGNVLLGALAAITWRYVK